MSGGCQTDYQCAVEGVFISELGATNWGTIATLTNVFGGSDPIRIVRLLYRQSPPSFVPLVPPLFLGGAYKALIENDCLGSQLGAPLAVCVRNKIDRYICELEETSGGNPAPQGGSVLDQAINLIRPDAEGNNNRRYLRPLTSVMREWVCGLRPTIASEEDSTFVAGAAEFWDEAELRIKNAFEDCYTQTLDQLGIVSRAVFNLGDPVAETIFNTCIGDRTGTDAAALYNTPLSAFGNFFIRRNDTICPCVLTELTTLKNLQETNFETAFNNNPDNASFQDEKNSIRDLAFDLHIQLNDMENFVASQFSTILANRFNQAVNVIQPLFPQVEDNIITFREQCIQEGNRTATEFSDCLREKLKTLEEQRLTLFTQALNPLRSQYPNLLVDRPFRFRPNCLENNNNQTLEDFERCLINPSATPAQRACDNPAGPAQLGQIDSELKDLKCIFDQHFAQFSSNYDFLRNEIFNQCATGLIDKERPQDIQTCIQNKINFYDSQILSDTNTVNQTIAFYYDTILKRKKLQFKLSSEFKIFVVSNCEQIFENINPNEFNDEERTDFLKDVENCVNSRIQSFLNTREEVLSSFFNNHPYLIFEFLQEHLKRTCANGIPGQTLTKEQILSSLNTELKRINTELVGEVYFDDIKVLFGVFLFGIIASILFGIYLFLLLRSYLIERGYLYDTKHATRLTQFMVKTFINNELRQERVTSETGINKIFVKDFDKLLVFKFSFFVFLPTLLFGISLYALISSSMTYIKLKNELSFSVPNN